MRDYLYIWRDLKRGCLVESGLEFSDFCRYLEVRASGVLLLDHNYQRGYLGPRSFEFVPSDELALLVKDDVESYGNFAWMDLPAAQSSGCTLPRMTNGEVAELLYFANQHEPLHTARISSMGNDFLVGAHDDGWMVRIFESSTKQGDELIKLTLADKFDDPLISEVMKVIQEANMACLVQNRVCRQIERTEDIDRLMNTYQL